MLRTGITDVSNIANITDIADVCGYRCGYYRYCYRYYGYCYRYCGCRKYCGYYRSDIINIIVKIGRRV